ncbi:hypothetical protein [Microcoleus sp. OTE_8_concoct_300]|uniref:hypothetical protein n=1 Tax=Microcoleus sp. OTE_8_concoct_300 TaxID=2964710 RepID=UPI00403F8C34
MAAIVGEPSPTKIAVPRPDMILVTKALISVSAEKVEAFITIAIIAKETLHPETKQLD